MNLLLFAFLTVALVITGIGFVLSPKSQEGAESTGKSLPREAWQRQPRALPPRALPPRSSLGAPQRGQRNVRAVTPQQSTQVARARRANITQPVSTRYVPNYTVELEQTTPVSQFFSRVNEIFEHRHEEPLPWTVAVVGLVSIVILGLALLTNLLPHQPLAGYVPFFAAAEDNTSTSNAANPPSSPSVKYTASQSVMRVSQLDPHQYSSASEYSTWAYSACSSASMTVVFNSYGRHYRITDVLNVESRIHEITPDLGLLEDGGVARTAAQFGFKTQWGDGNFSLDQVIKAANSGTPVIVSFPPNRYPDGHLLVVVGGNKDAVFTADSSYYNHKSFSRAQFMKYWGGFYAIATPK